MDRLLDCPRMVCGSMRLRPGQPVDLSHPVTDMKHFRFSGSAVVACLWASTSLLFIGVAQAKAYKLDELIEMARKGNPGWRPTHRSLRGSKRKRWKRTGTTCPRATCRQWWRRCREVQMLFQLGRQRPCAKTNFTFKPSETFAAITDLRGVFTRTELKIVQPIYTFGKISAGINAAELGVDAHAARHRVKWPT